MIQRTTGAYHGYMALILFCWISGSYIFYKFKDDIRDRKFSGEVPETSWQLEVIFYLLEEKFEEVLSGGMGWVKGYEDFSLYAAPRDVANDNVLDIRLLKAFSQGKAGCCCMREINIYRV